MDVRCERCGTEYDFDDALVSERGTTVKCTNCGHQFKVFPERASGLGPERWIVRVADGGVISFTSLRELQKGIAAGRVGPADQLSRGGQPPRPLSSIAELEPFFRSSVPRSGPGGKTLVGVAPPLPPGASAAPQPYLPSKSDRPPPPEAGAERQRGRTAPRLPAFDPPATSFEQESPVEAHPAPSAGQPSDPASEEQLIPPPDPEPSVDNPPATQAGPATESRERATAPGRLRSDTAGSLAQTLIGGSAEPAIVERVEETPTTAKGLGSTVQMPSPPTTSAEHSPSTAKRLGGTVRMQSPLAARAADPSPAAGTESPEPIEEVTLASLEEDTTVPRAVTEAEDKPPAGKAAPQAAAVVEEATPETLGAVSPSQQLPRRVPDVEPLEPAPADAVEAIAARTVPEIQEGPEQFYTPPPRELSFSGSLSDPDPRYVPQTRPRGARARWIVGLVVLGALLLLAGTVGLNFVRKYAQPEAVETGVVDPRVEAFVATGRRLIDEGDLDSAAAELSKASVLAERDPAVRLATAELELVRADRLWLQLRLLDPTAEDRVATVRRQLGAKLKRAREAVEAAVEVAPADAATTRERVDMLRLLGKLDEARRQVGPLGEQPNQPGNAYVLAALDLAESEPAFRSAIERLKKAASAEGRVGRARSALIYALALSGDPEQARAELSALSSANKAHPLLPELRAFLGRVDEGGSQVVLDADELEALMKADEPPPPVDKIADDFRARLAQANSALRNGHLDKAQRLFRAVLNEQPGNTEAMAGLAEVARQRNDPGAAEMYDKVLEKNPSYLPALVARADQKWDSGDRPGALVLYRRILGQTGPTTSYGRRAQARIAEATGDAESKKPSPASEPAPAPTPAESSGADPAPSPEQPRIDTTDLPGFQP